MTETQQIMDEAETVSLTAVQKEALEKAQAELESYRKELEEKKYLADVNPAQIKSILDYVSNEAPWKFTEALGIKEVAKEMEACAKKGKLFMNAISFEALYFYLSKIEGTGMSTTSKHISSLEDYLTILKAINVVRNVISHENEKLKEMEFVVASRAEGLEPEL